MMEGRARNITVLVKPASASCNLHCSYCFYLEAAKGRQESNRGIMGRDTAIALIATTLDLAAGGTVTYLFQGGEPLLAGLDFFQLFVNLVEEHRQFQTVSQERKTSKACYMVQTNGTLITKEFCQFFKQHGFALGVSLDGPPDIHNLYRTYDKCQSGAAPSRSCSNLNPMDCHQQVMKAIALLRLHKIPLSILSVVTRAWVGREEEIYHWFQDQGLRQLQFIYCIPPSNFRHEFCLTNQEYAQLNKRFFQLYWQDLHQNREVSIRFYDNLLAMTQGYQPEQCGMLGYCPATITIEADGSLYPCDFYCGDKWHIGNIKEMNLKELFYHPTMQKFITSSQQREPECNTCSVLTLCRGGCRRERDRDGSGNIALHHHCQGRKEFFSYFLTTIQSGQPGSLPSGHPAR